MKLSTPQRILIVNPFGIGDILFTTPVIRALRRAFPKSWIGYLCNRRTERILRNNPHLNELFIYEKDEMIQVWRDSPGRGLHVLAEFLHRIHQARIDLAVDLSLGERYGMILQIIGVPKRIGFNFRNRGRFLTERLSIDGYQDYHVVEYYRKLLRFIGVELLDPSTELHVSDEDKQWAEAQLRQRNLASHRPLVGIVPAGGLSWGGGAFFRRWHCEGFAAVADALVEQYNAAVILFGETPDCSTCATVSRLMHHPAVDLSGQTTLDQFVSLLGRLNLVICNDGGPLHLAVSQGVKTVSIFGPVDPQVYGPFSTRPSSHRVVFREDLPCRPCYHRFKLPPCPYERACLTTISPEEVLQACSPLLSESATPLFRPIDD